MRKWISAQSAPHEMRLALLHGADFPVTVVHPLMRIISVNGFRAKLFQSAAYDEAINWLTLARAAAHR